MKRLLLIILALCLNLPVPLFALTGSGFGTIQVRPSNKKYGALPVIKLSSDEYLTVSFDDLEDRDMQLRYRVVYLNSDGSRSELKEIEYLNGINNTDITLTDYSFNTRTNYVHYEFTYPEKGRSPKVSGAYMFEIYEPSNPQEVLLRIPFMVSEETVDIESVFKAPTRVEWTRTRQQMDVKVSTKGGFRPVQAAERLLVYAQQNLYTPGIRPLPLTYEIGNEYYYKDGDETVFDGLNDFRNFDIRPIKHSGRGVEHTEIIDGMWNARLQRQKSREYTVYSDDDDINGDFAVRADNTENSDLEAEYVWVHFLLEDEPNPWRTIYVIGRFNDWQCNDASRMTYRKEWGAYTLSLLLKQGFYDYMFACEENGVLHLPFLEGNHYETENDYYIYVFYRDSVGRNDRLLGVRRFNTRGAAEK